jgi:hypothetical protein
LHRDLEEDRIRSMKKYCDCRQCFLCPPVTPRECYCCREAQNAGYPTKYARNFELKLNNLSSPCITSHAEFLRVVLDDAVGVFWHLFQKEKNFFDKFNCRCCAIMSLIGEQFSKARLAAFSSPSTYNGRIVR